MFSLLPDELIKQIMSYHNNAPFEKQELLEVMKSRPKYMYDINDGALHCYEKHYDKSFVNEMIGNGGYETYVRSTLQYTFNDGAYIDNINSINEMYFESWLNPYFLTNLHILNYIKNRILRKDYNAIRRKLNYSKPLNKLNSEQLHTLLRFYIYNFY